MVSFDMAGLSESPAGVIYACVLFILVIIIADFVVKQLKKNSIKVEEEQKKIEERMAKYEADGNNFSK